ncbi:MAG: 2,3-diphosphoglycerate-dependent phosphoglycerate mutase [Candidatus Kapabacteria bacterium]|jgi:2,3-bisphosphoglycerate-dependent phosphoglycerate mutase|nr:2,3-diphosphoglycerate-dependent phosphoglycerate mutase [Candidatus Kapabacteria bacterium]
MAFLTLLRHGESQWNLENRFTGWVDVDLSPRGEREARAAGVVLRDIPIDVVFTSALTRAQRTARIALDAAGKLECPTHQSAKLNERHYGDLQGLNKAETAQRYGDEQVRIWRRSYDVPPPNGESLKDTRDRVLPYFEEHVVPLLKAGSNVLVVAHGNSLRALIMALEDLTPEQILARELPTGVPLTYELSEDLVIVSYTVHTPAM